MNEVSIDNYNKEHYDSLDYKGKAVLVIEDSVKPNNAKVLLCPSDAQEYKVPYDTFVKYCGDTLFWKEKCEEDWYYYE